MIAASGAITFIINDHIPPGKVLKLKDSDVVHVNLSDYFGYLIAFFGITKGSEMASFPCTGSKI